MSLTECAKHSHNGVIYLFIFKSILNKNYMVEKGRGNHLDGFSYVPFYVLYLSEFPMMVLWYLG